MAVWFLYLRKRRMPACVHRSCLCVSKALFFNVAFEGPRFCPELSVRLWDGRTDDKAAGPTEGLFEESLFVWNVDDSSGDVANERRLEVLRGIEVLCVTSSAHTCPLWKYFLFLLNFGIAWGKQIMMTMYLVSLGNTANTAGFQKSGINVPPAFCRWRRRYTYPIFHGCWMRALPFVWFAVLPHHADGRMKCRICIFLTTQ